MKTKIEKDLLKRIKRISEFYNRNKFGDLELWEAELTFKDYIPKFHRLRLRQLFLEAKLDQHKEDKEWFKKALDECYTRGDILKLKMNLKDEKRTLF